MKEAHEEFIEAAKNLYKVGNEVCDAMLEVLLAHIDHLVNGGDGILYSLGDESHLTKELAKHSVLSKKRDECKAIFDKAKEKLDRLLKERDA